MKLRLGPKNERVIARNLMAKAAGKQVDLIFLSMLGRIWTRPPNLSFRPARNEWREGDGLLSSTLFSLREERGMPCLKSFRELRPKPTTPAA